MINELISIKMNPTYTNNELVQLVNLIIRAHGLMQEIIWEGGLKTEVEKYRALRTILPTPSQKRFLDSLWHKESQRALGSYRCIVKSLIQEYVNQIARKNSYSSLGLSLHDGKRRALVKSMLPKVVYEFLQASMMILLTQFQLLRFYVEIDYCFFVFVMN